jgi:ATP-binding cassette subfamily B protein
MVIIFFGGMGVMRGEITYGDFVAFFAYLGLLLRPTVALGWILSLIQRAKVGLERLDEIFSSVATIADAPGAGGTPDIQGAIELRGFTFRYEDFVFPGEGPGITPGEDGRPYALRDVTLSLNPGEVVAIVGSVGSGKTTLLKAFPRMIEVPQGQVFLDGHDITRLPLEQLRRSVGYVPQDDFLFSISIAENIAFGRPDASTEEIEEAARLAAVHETITAFPDGYDTVVGERGITLSGGQRQRVALARALLIRPKVLVLDNALAHVDTETEREIMEGLHGLQGLSTILMATNRLARVKLADRIVVLEGGWMCATGTHDELMAASREYRELYEHERLFEELAEL